jgi:hypothetical protein
MSRMPHPLAVRGPWWMKHMESTSKGRSTDTGDLAVRAPPRRHSSGGACSTDGGSRLSVASAAAQLTACRGSPALPISPREHGAGGSACGEPCWTRPRGRLRFAPRWPPLSQWALPGPETLLSRASPRPPPSQPIGSRACGKPGTAS